MLGCPMPKAAPHSEQTVRSAVPPREDVPGSGPLEVRIGRSGDELLASLSAALDAIPNRPSGPQALSARLGIDKVLASRLLKAVRVTDPISVVHRMPGPEPLRRVLGALEGIGVSAGLLADARAAVDRFDHLIRHELGDRGSLDAIVSAWVPEARREFELRRKQAAYRAISQLRGAETGVILATVLVHPSKTDGRLDIVWINGLIGLRRLRPGAIVKLATRNMNRDRGERAPRAMDGHAVGDLSSLLLTDYCSSPLPQMKIAHAGDVTHYVLDGDAFGPGSGVDIVFAEVNREELNRFAAAPAPGAGGAVRRAYMFAEVSVPAAVLQFDVLVHKDVFPGGDPALRIHDTSFEGIADFNNRARDIDQLDLLEFIEPLGVGPVRFRSTDVPRYADLLRSAAGTMGWDLREFRGHRCRIDHPVYGSQVTMGFEMPVG